MPWGGQCALLLAGSLLLAALFAVARLPAALLLGPMIAAIFWAATVPALACRAVPCSPPQTIVGCLIARSITGDIVHAFPQGLAALARNRAGHYCHQRRPRLADQPLGSAARVDRGVGQRAGRRPRS